MTSATHLSFRRSRRIFSRHALLPAPLHASSRNLEIHFQISIPRLEVHFGKTLTKDYADITRQKSILLILVSITPFLMTILLRNFRLPFRALIVSTAEHSYKVDQLPEHELLI